MDEAEPNQTTTKAQKPASLPVVLMGATMSDCDEDCNCVKVPAGSSKTIHAFTYGDDPLTDTWVEILGSNGTSSLGPSDDHGFHEDFYSAEMGRAPTS